MITFKMEVFGGLRGTAASNCKGYKGGGVQHQVCLRGDEVPWGKSTYSRGIIQGGLDLGSLRG